jgi:hypothetical protein
MDRKKAIDGDSLDATVEGEADTGETLYASVSEKPTSVPDEPDLTTRIFHFLATATPGSLGAIAAALAVATYLILGRVGLVLIGAFGGIVLFIQWERQNADVARVTRGEAGPELLRRLLDERLETVAKVGGGDGEPEEEEKILSQGFDDFQPETREALNEFVDAVIRDYVKWWYSPIIPSDKFFPLSCRKTLTSFLLSISGHLSKKRPADAFLDFTTNSVSIVIVFLTELSAAFANAPANPGMSAADVVYKYLADKPESSLANLISQRQQAGKFRMVAEDLLGFLDRQSYECDPVRVFLREIIAGVMLEMTLQTCSKPDWINEWIVYLLEAGEPDISQAIDVGMQTGPVIENAFVDIDGNVGSISLSKGNRNSLDLEKSRRKDASLHKKKLSKADEEMELAMEEMKKLNEMIAQEEAKRKRESVEKLTSVKELDTVPLSDAAVSDLLQGVPVSEVVAEPAPRLSASSEKTAPRDGSSDESSRDDAIRTPATPHSMADSANLASSPKRSDDAPFTSFDQIVPPAVDEADDDEAPALPPRFTLHNATITIHDEPGDKSKIRTKPTWDYLIQVEPSAAQLPGWMIVRKYSDFERLHEILRRIAAVSGARAFVEQHATLPVWKGHTRASLRGELERYLRDACWYQPLAESEGMKKFLEKDTQGHTHTPSRSGLQAFENMGKNVLDALTNAPKNAVEGSKTVVGGVTGVLGNFPGMGPRRTTNSSLQDVTAASRAAISTPPRLDTSLSSPGPFTRSRDSLDSQLSAVVNHQPAKTPPMERRMSYMSQGEMEAEYMRLSRSERTSLSGKNSREHSRASSVAPIRSPSAVSLDPAKLPPPPSEIPDDYDGSGASSQMRKANETADMDGSTLHSFSASIDEVANAKAVSTATRPGRQNKPLQEEEARVAVELLFAVINELYTLSSAWNIRRTLLAAAKSFLLRPGNPSLLSIQALMQSSVLDANTSDAGIAAHLLKLRANTMPTDEERATWPVERTAEEKEKLRVKARALLIRSGVPAALMGVMGQSATTEALGRVFDCLQVEEVARGLMFGIILQAVKIVTH